MKNIFNFKILSLLLVALGNNLFGAWYSGQQLEELKKKNDNLFHLARQSYELASRQDDVKVQAGLLFATNANTSVWVDKYKAIRDALFEAARTCDFLVLENAGIVNERSLYEEFLSINELSPEKFVNRDIFDKLASLFIQIHDDFWHDSVLHAVLSSGKAPEIQCSFIQKLFRVFPNIMKKLINYTASLYITYKGIKVVGATPLHFLLLSNEFMNGKFYDWKDLIVFILEQSAVINISPFNSITKATYNSCLDEMIIKANDKCVELLLNFVNTGNVVLSDVEYSVNLVGSYISRNEIKSYQDIVKSSRWRRIRGLLKDKFPTNPVELITPPVETVGQEESHDESKDDASKALCKKDLVERSSESLEFLLEGDDRADIMEQAGDDLRSILQGLYELEQSESATEPEVANYDAKFEDLKKFVAEFVERKNLYYKKEFDRLLKLAHRFGYTFSSGGDFTSQISRLIDSAGGVYAKLLCRLYDLDGILINFPKIQVKKVGEATPDDVLKLVACGCKEGEPVDRFTRTGDIVVYCNPEDDYAKILNQLLVNEGTCEATFNHGIYCCCEDEDVKDFHYLVKDEVVYLKHCVAKMAGLVVNEDHRPDFADIIIIMDENFNFSTECKEYLGFEEVDYYSDSEGFSEEGSVVSINSKGDSAEEQRLMGEEDTPSAAQSLEAARAVQKLLYQPSCAEIEEDKIAFRDIWNLLNKLRNCPKNCEDDIQIKFALFKSCISKFLEQKIKIYSEKKNKLTALQDRCDSNKKYSVGRKPDDLEKLVQIFSQLNKDLGNINIGQILQVLNNFTLDAYFLATVYFVAMRDHRAPISYFCIDEKKPAAMVIGIYEGDVVVNLLGHISVDKRTYTCCDTAAFLNYFVDPATQANQGSSHRLLNQYDCKGFMLLSSVTLDPSDPSQHKVIDSRSDFRVQPVLQAHSVTRSNSDGRLHGSSFGGGENSHSSRGFDFGFGADGIRGNSHGSSSGGAGGNSSDGGLHGSSFGGGENSHSSRGLNSGGTGGFGSGGAGGNSSSGSGAFDDASGPGALTGEDVIVAAADDKCWTKRNSGLLLTSAAILSMCTLGVTLNKACRTKVKACYKTLTKASQKCASKIRAFFSKKNQAKSTKSVKVSSNRGVESAVN